jgi:hypothetical protein
MATDYLDEVAYRNARWERIKRLMIVGILALSIVLVGGLTYLVAEIRLNQQSGRQVLDLIQSCTTPGQPCYDDSQKRTAGAIRSINQVTITAAFCAAHNPAATVPKLHTCIIRHLDQQ